MFEVVCQVQSDPQLLSRVTSNDTTRAISEHSPLVVPILWDSIAVWERLAVFDEKRLPQPGNQVHVVELLVPILFVF